MPVAHGDRESEERGRAWKTRLRGMGETSHYLYYRPEAIPDGHRRDIRCRGRARSPLPVLLDLWAAWCGSCRMVAPMLDELATELAGRVRVAKLNVDENPATAGRFNVVSIPTLLVLKEGREVDRIVGVQPKAEIVRRLARVQA